MAAIPEATLSSCRGATITISVRPTRWFKVRYHVGVWLMQLGILVTGAGCRVVTHGEDEDDG